MAIRPLTGNRAAFCEALIRQMQAARRDVRRLQLTLPDDEHCRQAMMHLAEVECALQWVRAEAARGGDR